MEENSEAINNKKLNTVNPLDFIYDNDDDSQFHVIVLFFSLHFTANILHLTFLKFSLPNSLIYGSM